MLFEAVPDATVVVDSAGMIVLANTKACDLFGWTRAELTGAPIERLIPARFSAGHEKHRQRFSRDPDARPMGIDLELSGLRRDGVEFPVEIALNPFKRDGGAFVAASIRDLTHTMRFKNAATRALYSSQLVRLGELAMRAKGVDELLAAIPGFIVETLRTDVVIIYWAEDGARLRLRASHGVPESLLAEIERDANLIAMDASLSPAIVRSRIVRDYSVDASADVGVDAILTRALGVASSVRVPMTSKSGLIGLLETHSQKQNRFAEEELNFLQMVGNLFVELIMRSEVEAQLAHAQRLESIGQLTGGIAHDFNNILTVVMGNLQMLREALEPEGSGFIKLVESAQRASQRGAALTQKLLTFSRKQSLAPSAIDPAATLGALNEMLQRTLGEAIQIHIQIAPGCPACLADPLQLDNAIVNLALNARDAMPGGGSLRMTAAPVAVTAMTPDISPELPPGHYVMIAVADTGQGMPPDVLRRAYEPFFTTKPSGKGSGLGLSMVYGFAKQSGGTIRMESEVGRGTEVRLFFPATAHATDAAATLAGMPSAAVQSRADTVTILAVDDDLEVLNIADMFLTRCGFRVLRATGMEDALRWLAGPDPISLLFTDVVLGGGETGPKLVAAALKIRADLPVLYTSGFAHGSLGVADVRPIQFLAKPYKQDDLIARVEALLKEALPPPTG